MTAPGKEAAAGIRAGAVALALGFACTTLGACVAAARAGRRPLQHALLVALVAFLLSFARFVLFSVRPPEDPGALHPLPWELAGWALVFLAGLGGGLIGRRFQRTAAPPAP
jgi:hypothetical protein